MSKKTIDQIAMISVLAAIITGFMLHADVHHRHVYNNDLLWGIHEAFGIILSMALVGHCVQHKYWFEKFGRIKASKRRITTILLVIFLILCISGIILMCGSQSNEVSILHYVTGIVFTLIAVGHVAKRWKLFKNSK